MPVLLVTESCFGNTAAVGTAIADGLRAAGTHVAVVSAEAAPAAPAQDLTLVLVGAPTHNRRLPSPHSRAQAAAKGAVAPERGVAEWLAALDPRLTAQIVTFDTIAPGPFAGSAAKDAAARLRRRGIAAERGESFLVAGTALRAGELDRATAWGRRLAAGAPR